MSFFNFNIEFSKDNILYSNKDIKVFIEDDQIFAEYEREKILLKKANHKENACYLLDNKLVLISKKKPFISIFDIRDGFKKIYSSSKSNVAVKRERKNIFILEISPKYILPQKSKIFKLFPQYELANCKFLSISKNKFKKYEFLSKLEYLKLNESSGLRSLVYLNQERILESLNDIIDIISSKSKYILDRGLVLDKGDVKKGYLLDSADKAFLYLYSKDLFKFENECKEIEFKRAPISLSNDKSFLLLMESKNRLKFLFSNYRDFEALDIKDKRVKEIIVENYASLTQNYFKSNNCLYLFLKDKSSLKLLKIDPEKLTVIDTIFKDKAFLMVSESNKNLILFNDKKFQAIGDFNFETNIDKNLFEKLFDSLTSAPVFTENPKSAFLEHGLILTRDFKLYNIRSSKIREESFLKEKLEIERSKNAFSAITAKPTTFSSILILDFKNFYVLNAKSLRIEKLGTIQELISFENAEKKFLRQRLKSKRRLI